MVIIISEWSDADDYTTNWHESQNNSDFLESNYNESADFARSCAAAFYPPYGNFLPIKMEHHHRGMDYT